MKDKAKEQRETARYADMFGALGNEARLSIIRLLLEAHPHGMVVGGIQSELGIPASTLSHHLEKLKNEGLVSVERQGTFLWYRANTKTLQELLTFLYAECCTRSNAIPAERIVTIVRSRTRRL
jgi:DNA-binding transcriptional ArsR family regulator